MTTIETAIPVKAIKYDFKVLKPMQVMKDLMLGEVHRLQAVARTKQWNPQKRDYDSPIGEIEPVVFGDFPAHALLGRRAAVMHIVYDTNGAEPRFPSTWKESITGYHRTQIENDPNRLGIPVFLELAGVFELSGKYVDKITDRWGNSRNVFTSVYGWVFKATMPIDVPRLMGAMESSGLQAVQTAEKFLYSKTFRELGETGKVAVHRGGAMKPHAMTAATQRASALEESLFGRIDTLKKTGDVD